VDDLLIILVHGIGAGSVFVLVGTSFNVVFNATGILNFAQGNMRATYAISSVLAVFCFVALQFFHIRMLTGLAISANTQDLIPPTLDFLGRWAARGTAVVIVE
jgi:branched-subunit amino acid ABC-type transport system permease component